MSNNRWRRVVLACGIAGVLMAPSGAMSADAPTGAGQTSAGAKTLFIDDHSIARIEGMRRVFHTPVKHQGPLIVPNQRWEEDFVQMWQPPAWSPERNCWQLWYYGGSEFLPLYAESTDGVEWTKPKLGLVEWKGSTENNLIDLGPGRHPAKENFLAVLRDDRDADPARRYKGITHVGAKLAALVSADGLRWKRLEGDQFYSEDQYRLNYDAIGQRFAAAVKFKRGRQGRVVGLSFSEDFTTWTKPNLSFVADETDQQLGQQRMQEALRDPDRRHPHFVNATDNATDVYNMPIFTYADMYLGLPVLFNHSGTYGYNNRTDNKQDGILYPTLVASRDLKQWDRLSREPFLRHSPLSDKDNWDYAMIHVCCPVQHGAELWFYYTGARFTHLKREVINEAKLRTSPDEPLRAIFLARMRLDGFASLEAHGKRGIVVTTPFRLTGRKLALNYSAKTGGRLRVEVQQADGTPIEGLSFADGQALVGDSVAEPVHWKSADRLAKLMGQPVRLRFELSDAALYSYQLAD